MTGGVPAWQTDRSLHPTLRVVAASSAGELAQVLAAGLKRAGYELSGRNAEAFSARQADPAVVRILKPVEATVLDVEVATTFGSNPSGAAATIRVRTGTQRRAGMRRAATGLSHAVEQLAHRGVEVSVQPWDYQGTGSLDDEIPGWDKHVQTFHPQLSLRGAAPTPVVLDALAAGLQGVGYTLSRRSPAGFRARYHNWLRLGLELATFVGGSAERTTLDIAASSNDVGGVVTIRVAGGFEHWGSRDLAAQGLTSAVKELRAQGHEVEATPWRAK